MSVKIREVLATIHYAESGRKEQKLVHFLFTKDHKKYQLYKHTLSSTAM
jgi:hypothetical protein